MKRILKRVSIVLFALFLTAGVVMSDYETVYATGIEETLYYTYWDLITTLYSVTGYDSSVDQEVIKNHGVTGKQAWSNFCKMIENYAKAHGKFLDDGFDFLSELSGLTTSAIKQGSFTISQELYDLLRDCFADTATVSGNYKNQFDCSSSQSVRNILVNITGACDQLYNINDVCKSVASGSLLSLYLYTSGNGQLIYRAYASNGAILNDFELKAGYKDLTELSADNIVAGATIDKDGSCFSGVSEVASLNGLWVIRNGAFCIDFPIDVVDVAADACPQEVPDSIEIVENPAIPDGWRIVEPDEDPQNDDDVIPALLPIVPPIPDKPTDTEKDSEKDTENEAGTIPKPNPNPDSDLNPKPDPNPDPDPEIDSDPVQSVTSSAGDITTLFPFCIPFDIARLVKGLKAKKAPPVFHFEYKFKQINYTFVIDVDLSDYEKYIKIFRYGMQIFYIIALMFLTIKVSKLFI